MEISANPLYLLFGFLLIALTIFIGGYLLERRMKFKESEKIRLHEEGLLLQGYRRVWVYAPDSDDGDWQWRKLDDFPDFKQE